MKRSLISPHPKDRNAPRKVAARIDMHFNSKDDDAKARHKATLIRRGIITDMILHLAAQDDECAAARIRALKSVVDVIAITTLETSEAVIVSKLNRLAESNSGLFNSLEDQRADNLAAKECAEWFAAEAALRKSRNGGDSDDK